MKKILHLFTILYLTILLINCSDSVNESEPVNNIVDQKGELTKLFPLEVGNSYTYSVDTLNNNANIFENIGKRIMNIENKLIEGESDHFICSENYELFNLSERKQSIIIFTKNSIEFFVDSSGVSSFISDSIKFDVTIKLDERAVLVQYPYAENEKWAVFNAYANFAGAKIKIFSIMGEYSGSENLKLTNFGSEIETEKFTYKGELNLPDIKNPFVSYLQTYIAHAWISPEHGIVKLEGFAMFTSPLTGMHFNISDSNKVYRHTLISTQ